MGNLVANDVIKCLLNPPTPRLQNIELICQLDFAFVEIEDIHGRFGRHDKYVSLLKVQVPLNRTTCKGF